MIAEIGENPHVHKELLRNTVEIVTGICDNACRGDGRSARRRCAPVRRIVHDRGMELFCAGTHPFAEWSAAAADRRAALRRADQAHPVVGPADADLGCARPRRGLLGAQGDADHHLAAQPVPAPAGAVGVVAVLGRRGHRIRQQPRDDVPAAADRRPAVPLPDAGRSSSGSSTTRRRPASSTT